MFILKKKKHVNFILFVFNSFVLLQVTTLSGFIFATINTTMVPNYANIMLICHVLLTEVYYKKKKSNCNKVMSGFAFELI